MASWGRGGVRIPRHQPFLARHGTHVYDGKGIEREHAMTGAEFERKVRRHGKGSHGRLYYGERFTTLKDRKKEIGKGLLGVMCSQFGIEPEDL